MYLKRIQADTLVLNVHAYIHASMHACVYMHVHVPASQIKNCKRKWVKLGLDTVVV